MKVLVTGGAGFIGSHTVDLCLQRGYAVRVFDNLQPRVHPRGKPDYVPPDVEFIQGDVRDRDALGRALDGITHVFHLAAYQDYFPDFGTFVHTNSVSSALLFELIVERKLPVEKIVFASSQSVAGEGRFECEEHGPLVPEPRSLQQLAKGDWEHRCPNCSRQLKPLLIDEGTAQPHTAYAISKYCIELLAARLGSRYGIPTACMRYTYVQGPRNSFFNAYSGIARRFALRIMHGLPPICYEDGQQLRDYVHVSDIARANLTALEHPDARGVYNAGGGHAITVLDFARLMLREFGSDLQPTVPGEYRVGDTRHTVSDNSRMNTLGWTQQHVVSDNVRDYVAWIRTFTDTREFLEEAERVMREQGIVRSVARAADG